MPSWTATTTWSTGQTPTATQFNNYLRDDMDIANRGFFALSFSGSITSGVGSGSWVAPWPGTIADINASVGVASTAGSVVFDVRRNSTTVFSATSVSGVTVTSGQTEGTALTPGVTAFTSGDVITASVTTNSGSAATAWGTVVVSFSGA